MNRRQKGSGCGDYVDPALEYRHCGNAHLEDSINRQNGGAGSKNNRKQRGGKYSLEDSLKPQKGGSNQTYENAVQLLKTQYEVPSDVTNTYLSEKTSELTGHWANPEFPARGGSYVTTKNTRKQKGAALDYPFESQYNEYPIPNKINFAIDEGISKNFVSNKDLFGCTQKGGSTKKQQDSLKFQNGGKTRLEDSLKFQNGGDCGCNQPISLGGSISKSRKQKGAGYGYNLDVSQAITNRPEVIR